jgi:hypothetical protein
VEVAARRRCPACEWGTAVHAHTIDGYSLVRCTGCNGLFVDPLPTGEQLASIYLAPDYYDRARSSEERIREQARERAQRLRDLGVRTILEIGCADGFFLSAARDAGMNALGVEPGVSAERAIAAGHEVFRGWLDDYDPGSRRFDAVVMWEVLEHMPVPRTLLERARSLTSQYVALSTPSVSGLPARLLGRCFPMLTPPEHIVLFSRTGLAALLRSTGFRVKEWRSFSGLGTGELERGFQKFVFGRSSLATHLARNAARVAVLPARWMDAAGLGSEFEIYAQRE